MIKQDMLVLQDDDQYLVMTEITHETVAREKNASTAIQAAVGALGGGGTITLGRGTFRLDKPARLADRVWLRGKGRDTRLVVGGANQVGSANQVGGANVGGAANQEGIGLLCDSLEGAAISDLTIVPEGAQTGRAGIILDACGDTQVRHVFAGGFSGYGIWVRNSSFLCTIESCSLAGNGAANIYLEELAKGRGGEFIPNLVSGCTIYGGGKGIECKNTIVANIIGCCVFQTRDTGFHLHSQSNSIVINGCRTFQVGKYAVLLEDTDEFNLTGNIFCWHIEDGVVIRNANWGTICGNEVIDTGSFNSGVEDFTARWESAPKDLPPYSAIKLHDTRGYTVSGNSIFNWGVAPAMEFGIYEDADCYNNNFSANNINYYAKKDVESLGKHSTTSNNISSKQRPHHIREREMPEFFQTFQTELTDEFIFRQLK